MAEGKDRNVALWRQNLVVIFVLIVAAIFLVRLMIMQIAEGESYRSYLTEGYSVTKTIEASRGGIVDRYGRSLAANRVRYDITFDKNNIVKDSENSFSFPLKPQHSEIYAV